MKIDITQGVYHLLQAAEQYRSPAEAVPPDESSDVTSLGVLLAMQDEDEYRASTWLAEQNIHRDLIAETFSFEKIAPVETENKNNRENSHNLTAFLMELRFYLDDGEVTVGKLESKLANAIFWAIQRLYDILPQVVLSTEHLLYALFLEEGRVGRFLRNQNVTPEQIFEQIRELEGVPESEPEILSIAWDDVCEQDIEVPAHHKQTLPPSNVRSDICDVDAVDLQEEQTNCELPQKTGETDKKRLSAQLPDESTALYRILDASANRAVEAMRVIEDYVRFALDDEQLLREAKQMRHELVSALRELPQHARLVSRNTSGDVGTRVEGANEYCRLSITDVLGANFSRLQESLRSLEEYGKLLPENVALQASLSRTVEQLRYRSYTLQKNVLLPGATCGCDAASNPLCQRGDRFAAQSFGLHERLASAKCYVLVDCRPTEAEFVELVQAVLAGGADVIQLRDKLADDRTLLQRARVLREMTVGTQTLMIVNDRPDIAALCRADGVHVGQEELSVADVRCMIADNTHTGGASDHAGPMGRNVPPMLVGVSTHSIEQARQAVVDGADYIGVGPVFPSTTKDFDEFPGLDFLKQIAAEIALPAFAIGGINLENLSRVLQTGVTRVAVQSVVTEAVDPAEACRQIIGRQLERNTL